MGCDIHSVAQVRKDQKWTTVFQDVAGDERSYDTFAMLANVRNGYGFAGIKTGEGFEPISEPRGLPKDFEVEDLERHKIPANTPSGNDFSWSNSEEYRQARLKELAESTEVWMGDHSHSYLTLAEINAYIKAQERYNVGKRGTITEEDYAVLKTSRKRPESWSGAVSGKGILTVSEIEYCNKYEGKPKPEGVSAVYIDYHWTESVLDCGYLVEISAELGRLAELNGVGPEDVRMVFGFDS